MLLGGVHLFHGSGFVSTTHTERDLEQTVEALRRHRSGAPGRGPSVNDLAFAGGRVIDPAQDLDALMDLAVSGGVVSALGQEQDGTARPSTCP